LRIVHDAIHAKSKGNAAMTPDQRFDDALGAIDAANAEDPRRELVDGTPVPRESLFSRHVYEWITKLMSDPSTELLLAARACAIRRWEIPRDQYPMTTPGYHQWRDALADFHAEQAAAILREVGYSESTVTRVKDLITKKHWPDDDEANALEDAMCLTFLETKLSKYLDVWDTNKTHRILAGTLRKMTPAARQRVLSLSLGARERTALNRASDLV